MVTMTIITIMAMMTIMIIMTNMMIIISPNTPHTPKWLKINMGTFLEIFFSRFSELGGGPLGHTLGCHQNFDILGINN